MRLKIKGQKPMDYNNQRHSSLAQLPSLTYDIINANLPFVGSWSPLERTGRQYRGGGGG